MRNLTLIGGMLLIASGALASPSEPHACPSWMTDVQCIQVLSAYEFAMPVQITPLAATPQQCTGDPKLNMCARSINLRLTNYHSCPGVVKPVRCDIPYCEYNECFNTSCSLVAEGYCCSSTEYDWTKTEVKNCV